LRRVVAVTVEGELHGCGSEKDVKSCCLGTARLQKLDCLVKIDLATRGELQGVAGVEPSTNKLLKAPAQNLVCLNRSELLQLGRSHEPSTIVDVLIGL
jgi:hypothetical protein